jgi:glucokinase
MLVTVDTGGTKTLVAGFSKHGVPSGQVKFPTPKTPTEYVKVLTDTLIEEFGAQTVEALVIALPSIVRDNVAIFCPNLGWKNFDAAKAFKGVLGKAPVLVENDANLAGLAETRRLRPVPRFALYVTISTGIGTGIITNGHIDPIFRYSEGGLSVIEFDGTLRPWENFASGQTIHDTYKQYAKEITSKRTWNQIADRISRGFLVLVPILQPDVIVIGGSIGTYFDHYRLRLIDILHEKLPSHIPIPKIIRAKHTEQAVIYGGFYYALDSLADSTS